jgi:hypothetical protein
MRGWIRYAESCYRLVEVTEAEMDALIQSDGDGRVWPHRFSRVTRCVWPPPRASAEVFYEEDD